ncbi:TMV resistance protein N-like [Nymphaea colorata]|nr:TMV resistance protein N-like [Nymphaea colorata]
MEGDKRKTVSSKSNTVWERKRFSLLTLKAINKLVLHSIPKGGCRRRQLNLKPQIVHGQASSLTPKARFSEKYRGQIRVNYGKVTFSGIDRKTRDELKNPEDEPSSHYQLAGSIAEQEKVICILKGGEGLDVVELVQCVVKGILTEVKKTPLFAAKHAVGLDSRIADLMEVLDIEAQDDARIVGIHGMGGIGKTTLAKAVYNQIFDACSFIVNIREAAKQPSGLISLQKQLLRDVFKVENMDISSTSDGMHKFKERIQSKKVLLVLDDLDHESQLDALVGSLDWFCSGSRIINTTRDRQILGAPKVEINNVYELGGLDATQSLQLFCWHAFGTEEPAEEFAELSREVASVAAGLPLTLRIFGSHFFHLKTTKNGKLCWKG